MMGGKKRGNRVLHTNAAILDILWFSYFFVLVLPLKRGKNVSRKRMRQRQKRGGTKGNELVCLVNSCAQRTISGTFFCLWWQQKKQEICETKPWLAVIWIYRREENASPPMQQPCISHMQTHFHDISVSPQTTCLKWNQWTFFYWNTFSS